MTTGMASHLWTQNYHEEEENWFVSVIISIGIIAVLMLAIIGTLLKRIGVLDV